MSNGAEPLFKQVARVWMEAIRQGDWQQVVHYEAGRHSSTAPILQAGTGGVDRLRCPIQADENITGIDHHNPFLRGL